MNSGFPKYYKFWFSKNMNSDFFFFFFFIYRNMNDTYDEFHAYKSERLQSFENKVKNIFDEKFKKKSVIVLRKLKPREA